MNVLVAMTLLALASFPGPGPGKLRRQGSGDPSSAGACPRAGNADRIEGLETALGKVRAHCTDAGLQAERQEEIGEAREEIREREAELQEALDDGHQQKFGKRERKLAEAREALRGLQGD